MTTQRPCAGIERPPLCRSQFAAAPGGGRHPDGTPELPAEMIDVAKAARLRDLGERRLVLDDQRLRVHQTLPGQPLSRTGAQMSAEQSSRLRVAEACHHRKLARAPAS